MSLSTLQRLVALSWSVGLSIVPAAPASAVPVTFTFQGATTAGGVDAFQIFGPEEIPAGQPFTFSYTFESTTPDSDADPEFGQYVGAVSSFIFTMGGQTLTLTPNIHNEITVANVDQLGEDLEEYGLQIGEALIEDGIVTGFAVLFSTGLVGGVNAFESDALPTTLSDLNCADHRFALDVRPHLLAEQSCFTMFGAVGPLEEEPFRFLRLPGSVFAVTVVPEPGTLALIILALGCLACVRFRPGRQVRE